MNSDLKNKLFAQALLAFSQVAFPLITYPIVTNALASEGLGSVNFADSIVQAFLILFSLGIPLYGIREVAIRKKDPAGQSILFRELFLLQLMALLPAALGVWFIGRASGVEETLLLTGIIALASSALSSEWYFQGKENFLFIAIRSFLLRTLAALLIFLFVKDPSDTLVYYAILTGTVFITLLLNLTAITGRLNLSFVRLRPFVHLKKMNWLFACYVLASLYTVTDTLLLGWLTDQGTVGHYSFAYKMVRMSAMLIPILGIVFIPRIAFHHAAEDSKAVQQQVNASQRIIYFFCIPLSLFFLVMAPEIVSVFANADFLPSVNVIRILSLVPLLVSFTHLTGTQILISVKKEKIYFGFLMAGMVLNIITNLLLIPGMGEKGAAIANLATEAFVAIATFFYLRKMELFTLAGNPLISSISASLIIVPVSYTLRLTELTSLAILILSGVVGSLFYLLIQFLLPSGKLLMQKIYLPASNQSKS